MIKELQVVGAVCDLCHALGPCVEKSGYQGEVGAAEKYVRTLVDKAGWKETPNGKHVCFECLQKLKG